MGFFLYLMKFKPMKIFHLIILLFTANLFAQNQRFIYEYKFIQDSTNRQDVKSELLVLDLNKSGSKFYSYEKYRADSVMYAELKKQVAVQANNILVNNTYKGNIRYLVEKSYPDFKTFIYNYIAGDDYKISDDRKMNWKILPATETIGTFKTQKAETEMYGRKWTAWFTTDVPVQDGPYKFHGLPGLIVKIQDKTESHIFELKGVRKDVAPTDTTHKRTEKPVEITQAQYKKLFWENRKDPAKSLRLMINENPTFKVMKNGVEVSGEQMIREREKTAKENQKKFNNALELDLLKE